MYRKTKLGTILILLNILSGYHHQVYTKNLLVDYVQRVYRIKHYVRYIGNEYTDIPYIVDHIRIHHGIALSTFDLMRIARTDRGNILVPIPDVAEYYTLYKMSHIPEDNPHNSNTVIKIHNMRSYIAVSRARDLYTTDVRPCPMDYCLIDNVPVWKAKISPSCSSSLFFNDTSRIANLCHYEVTEKTSLPVISHVENKLKIISFINESVELLCERRTTLLNARERQTLVIKLKPECSVMGEGFNFNYPKVMTMKMQRNDFERTTDSNGAPIAKMAETKAVATRALFTGVFSYIPSLASIIAIIYILVKVKRGQLTLPGLIETITARELLPMRAEVKEQPDIIDAD